MCLRAQLLRTGSSGHWLKQKKLWARISGSSPFLAGPGFRCPLPGVLGFPRPVQAPVAQDSLTMEVTIWARRCSPLGCALPTQPLLQALHGAPAPQGPLRSPLQPSPCEQRGGGDSSPPQMMPLTLGCSPGLAGGVVAPDWVPTLFLMGLRWAPRKGLAAARMDAGDVGQHP